MLNILAFAGIFGVGFTAIIIIVLIAVLIFEIAMIIDAIKNKHITDNARILWIIGMLIIHPIIAIAYYFTDYKKGKK
jgi:hypothetical protein